MKQLEICPPNRRRGESLLAVSCPMGPRAFARPRASGQLRADGTPFARIFDDPEYTKWKHAMSYIIRAFARDEGIARIDVPCIFAATHVYSRPTRKPTDYQGVWSDERCLRVGPSDLDNLDKAVLDALVWSEVLLDDRLIVENGGSRKVYAARGEEACVEIRIWRA